MAPANEPHHKQHASAVARASLHYLVVVIAEHVLTEINGKSGQPTSPARIDRGPVGPCFRRATNVDEQLLRAIFDLPVNRALAVLRFEEAPDIRRGALTGRQHQVAQSHMDLSAPSLQAGSPLAGDPCRILLTNFRQPVAGSNALRSEFCSAVQ